MTDEVETFLSETPCAICQSKEFYEVRYIPNKPDRYRVCAGCGHLLGDEVVTKE